MSYNANDRKQIRDAKRMARLDDRARQATISSIMSTSAGRQYVYNLLSRCHMFGTSFSTNALSMAFAEGERNIGLALVADIMPICSEQYITMIRESNDRHLAADARTSGNESSSDDSEFAGPEDDPAPGIEADRG